MQPRDEAGRFVVLYKPEFCQQMIDLAAQGYSMNGVAGKLGVTRRTLYYWRDAHPEFAEAMEIAITAAGAFWEERLIEMSKDGAKGNASVVIFGVKNRAREDWLDVQRQELTGADGGPLATENKTTVDVTGLSDEQLAALASIRTG